MPVEAIVDFNRALSILYLECGLLNTVQFAFLNKRPLHMANT